jgi:type VI secretion system secreted protein VgrG
MSAFETIGTLLFNEFQQRDRMLDVYFDGMPDELLPRSFLAQRLEFTESLSTPFRAVLYGITSERWRIPGETGDVDQDIEAHPDRFLGLPTGIVVRAEGRVRRIHGIVTGVRHLGDWHSKTESDSYHAFELVVESPLRLFDLRRASRVFQERGTLEIVNEIVAEQSQRNMFVAQTLRSTFPYRADADPRRGVRTQYQETDLDFIQRQMIDAGLSYVLDAEFGEGSRQLLGNAFRVFGPDHDFGTDFDAILNTRPGKYQLPLLDWYARRRIVPSYSVTSSHDYRKNAHFEGYAGAPPDYFASEHARGALGWYEGLSPRAVADPSTGMDRPALIRQWAHDMDGEVYEGQTTGPLNLGRPIEVLGLDSPRISRGSSGNEYVVTAQTIVATAAIAPSLRERWDSLAEQVRSRTGVELFPADERDNKPPLVIRFEAQPSGKPLVPRHPVHAKRPMPGPVTATVVGAIDAVVDTDALGRIAVVFHWERPLDVPENAHRFAEFPAGPITRVRYVHPGAGQNVGMQYLPRVGDEVLVVFIDNDPDKPIAVGSVHNGALGTPSFGGVSVLPEDAALTGLRTGEHKGAGANEFVMDDTNGEVGLRVGSTTAGTTLSLGHIATPRQQGDASARGTGAELRTDGTTALRAAQGMLISTHKAETSAKHMHHEDLRDLLTKCRKLLKSIESSVIRHEDVSDSSSGRDQIDEALATWSHLSNLNRPVIAFSSPDGIVSATSAGILEYAGTTMDLIAARGVQLHSGTHASVAAAQGISLHTADVGITAESEKGPIVIGSISDHMKLQARTDIFLTAIDGVIRLHAPMIELISESGSYIRVGDGIEVGSPSGLLVKVPEVAYVDAASLSAETVPRDAAEQDDAEEARLHYGDTPHDENGARGATADTV